MDPVLSYDFDEIEYAVRQQIHATSARFNAALDDLRTQIGRASCRERVSKQV